MRAQLGIAPIAWTNDDLPELGGDTSLTTCLQEARDAGFSGVETGGKFPKTSAELGPILQEHRLQLCGGWYSGTVLDNDLAAERDQAWPQLELFRDLQAPCLVYGETAGTIQNQRDVPLQHRRRLSADDIKSYGRKLTAFAEWCAENGMPIAFHHHMGTAIESEEDLDLLMRHSGEPLYLLYDAGHMAFAGGDVLRVIDNHAARIKHVHTKDVRWGVINKLEKHHSFLDAVLRGAFTVPGDGDLDFAAIVQRLADHGYEGWFVVEAEQDPALAPPAKYARTGFAAVQRELIANGYRIVDEFEGA